MEHTLMEHTLMENTIMENTIKSTICNPINDIWIHIFQTIGYDGTQEQVISTTQIKDARNSWTGKKNQFEPRLLCKYDSSESRPEIFKHYNICILSISNESYLLTKTDIYFTLDYPISPLIELHKNHDSILLQIGNSEMSNIDNLRYCGLFEQSEYLNEPILFGSLLGGRHRCNFTTKLGSSEITVSGSQFETDSCYESQHKILLIEGKTGNTKSFNIRQIYYSYRTIYDKVFDKKEIIPIFINKDSKNIIHIWKLAFADPLEFTSIQCISYNKYKFV